MPVPSPERHFKNVHQTPLKSNSNRTVNQSIVHVQCSQMLYRWPTCSARCKVYTQPPCISCLIPDKTHLHHRLNTSPTNLLIHDPYSAFAPALAALPIDPTLPLVFLTPLFASPLLLVGLLALPTDKSPFPLATRPGDLALFSATPPS